MTDLSGKTLKGYQIRECIGEGGFGAIYRAHQHHDEAATGAVWNDDETRILSWSKDDTARIWDAANGDPILTMHHDGDVLGAVWDSDETHLLTRSMDGTARVWNAESGQQLVVAPHNGTIGSAAWDDDESRFITWSYGAVQPAQSNEVIVQVWPADVGELLAIGQSRVVRPFTAEERQRFFLPAE